MKTTSAPRLTAQVIFDEAFPTWRPKRSEAYRAGVLHQLRYRMMEGPKTTCPYADGSAESDAYWAGVQEAWNLVHKHDVDRRKYQTSVNDPMC